VSNALPLRGLTLIQPDLVIQVFVIQGWLLSTQLCMRNISNLLQIMVKYWATLPASAAESPSPAGCNYHPGFVGCQVAQCRSDMESLLQVAAVGSLHCARSVSERFSNPSMLIGAGCTLYICMAFNAEVGCPQR